MEAIGGIVMVGDWRGDLMPRVVSALAMAAFKVNTEKQRRVVLFAYLVFQFFKPIEHHVYLAAVPLHFGIACYPR